LLGLSIIALLISGGWEAERFWKRVSTLVPTVGGTYTEALIGFPQHINPLLTPLSASDTDADLTSLIYSGLFTFNDQKEFTPDLVDTYTVSDDGRTYTFHIRSGTEWQDGQPISTDDVDFTIKTIQNAQTGSPLQGLLQDVVFAKIDQSSFTMTLKEAWTPFVYNLTFGIVPQHIWYNIPPQQIATTPLNLSPIGSGPYMVDRLIKDSDGNIQSLELIRNSRYYRGAPSIERLQFLFFSDSTTAAEAVLTGKAHAIAFVSKDTRDQLLGKENQLRSIDIRLPEVTAVFFNTDRDLLSDQVIRTSLAQAVQRQQLIDGALQGAATPITSPLLPGYFGYDDQLKTPGEQRDQAKQALDAAGWIVPDGTSTALVSETTTADDGSIQITPSLPAVRSRDGKTLSLTLTSVDLPEYRAAATELQRQWGELGVAVTIHLFRPETITQAALAKRDYDMLLFGQTLGPDADLYPFWHSSQQTSPGAALSIFFNRNLDQLLEQARQSTVLTDRATLTTRIQSSILDLTPAIFLYQPHLYFIVHQSIHGIPDTQYLAVPANRFYTINQWVTTYKRVLK
jgi:peptide/nickel transport system substrate-binding protein